MEFNGKYLFQRQKRRIAMTHDAECWKMVPNIQGEYDVDNVIPLARVANLIREQVTQKREQKKYKKEPTLYVWNFIKKRVWGNDWVRATLYEKHVVDIMIAYIMLCYDLAEENDA